MAEREILQAVAQAHFDTYTEAIKAGKTPARAMQMADAAATTKRLAFTDISPTQGQEYQLQRTTGP